MRGRGRVASAKVSIFSSGLNTAITLLALYSRSSTSSAITAPAATANIDASVSAALTRQIVGIGDHAGADQEQQRGLIDAEAAEDQWIEMRGGEQGAVIADGNERRGGPCRGDGRNGRENAASQADRVLFQNATLALVVLPNGITSSGRAAISKIAWTLFSRPSTHNAAATAIPSGRATPARRPTTIRIISAKIRDTRRQVRCARCASARRCRRRKRRQRSRSARRASRARCGEQGPRKSARRPSAAATRWSPPW